MKDNKNKKDVAKKIGKKTIQKAGKKKTQVLVAVPKPRVKAGVVQTLSQPDRTDEISWDIIELSQESRQSSQQSNPSSSQGSNKSESR